MSKTVVLVFCSFILATVLFAAPKRMESLEAARIVEISNIESTAYTQLAAAIRAAKDFKELQTVMADWADAQSVREKDKKKPKIK